MLTFRIEHPHTRIGPYREDRMDEFHRRLFSRHTKTDSMALPPSPADDIEREMALRRESFLRNFDEFNSNGDAFTTDTNTGTDLIFGCSTREQLDRWFPGIALSICQEYGYVEAVYQVPDSMILVTQCQTMWVRKNGVLLAHRPLECQSTKAVEPSFLAA
jgi:hypothetical protein